MMMEARLREILENVGLTQAESKIYMMLLKSGSSLAGDVTKKTGLHRRTVYDVLRRLIEKGLAGYIVKNNRYYFESVKPDHLKDYIKEKENLIDEAIPLLKKLDEIPKKREKAKFFTGKYGLKTVFEDQIHEKKPIFIIGASPDAYEIFKYYFKWFDKRRKKNKIHVKAIFSSSVRQKLKKIPLAQIRFLSQQYLGLAAVNVYGNKVSLILWSEESFAILIENKDISESYRKFFELLWKQARE